MPRNPLFRGIRLGSLRRLGVAFVAALAYLSSAPALSPAAVVAPGWDLLETGPGTTFMGAPFLGVPLGTFDFGGTIGVQNVGTADTIVRRLDPASVAAPPDTALTIDTELVALQLVSATPIDIGSGLHLYYITLQSARTGTEPPVHSSPGTMDITFDTTSSGTFDSFFDVFFDIRIDALNGPIVLSNNLELSSTNVHWDRTAPLGSLLIPNVNHELNGIDTQADFWPITPFSERHPDPDPEEEGDDVVHEVIGSAQPSVPEPGTLVIWSLLGVCGLAVYRRRRGIFSSSGD